MSIRRCAGLAALMAALVCLPALAASPSTPPRELWTPAHTLRPSLRITTLQGTPFDLATQHGKWVLVFFWASWCSPCTASMPAISRFVDRHSDVRAIGLAVEDHRKAITRFASRQPLSFPLASIDQAELQGLSASVPANPEYARPAIAIPVTWLIAPDGTLMRVWTGSYDVRQLKQIMQAAGYPDTPKP